jgi:hypothetical protein
MPERVIPHFHDLYLGNGYERALKLGPCLKIAEIIDDFLDHWRNNMGDVIGSIDTLLSDVDNAQLGTAIQDFLGPLDDPDWQHHWDALNAAPTLMKEQILNAARDAAVNELDLYIDMTVDYGGAYGVEVTTGFDSDGSWRYLNMVHPAPNAS